MTENNQPKTNKYRNDQPRIIAFAHPHPKGGKGVQTFQIAPLQEVVLPDYVMAAALKSPAGKALLKLLTPIEG